MPDAIQAAIAYLQQEKRANDPVSEPIIMPNAALQAALAEIEAGIIVPGTPLAITSGGTGTNTFIPASGPLWVSGTQMFSADLTPIPCIMLWDGGAGIVAAAMPLAPSLGGTGAASFYVGTGTTTLTDQSGAALGNLGTCQWFAVGRIVLCSISITYPSNGSGVNAIVGGLPFPTHGVNGTFFMRFAASINPNYLVGVAGVNATTFALFNPDGANFLNSGLQTVPFTGSVVYEGTTGA